MRTALLSDIHANRHALEAVVQHAKDQGVIEFISLGDVVGYGPAPNECLEILEQLGAKLVEGNHDKYVRADQLPRNISPFAAMSLSWTREVVPKMPNMLDFYKLNDLTLVHACPGPDQSYWKHTYIFQEDGLVDLRGPNKEYIGLLRLMQQHPIPTKAYAVGHTHVQGIFDYTHGYTYKAPFSINMDAFSGVLNVGSVGQPRDGDWRAAYAIYDQEKEEITFHRVPYEMAMAIQDGYDKVPELVRHAHALGILWGEQVIKGRIERLRRAV